MASGDTDSTAPAIDGTPTPTTAADSDANTASTAVTDTNGANANDVAAAGQDCPCYKVSSGFGSLQCGICQRVIPALEETDSERQRLLKESEQTKQRLEDEVKRAASEAKETERLRTRIKELEQTIAAKDEEHQSVQRDLTVLNDKYVDEIEKVAEMQHAKEMVENELEELSRTLFEEANGMVASEARARHQLELTRRHLELELKDARERLGAETSQLKELKSKMEVMIDSQSPSKRSSTNTTERGSVDLAQIFGLNRVSEMEPASQEPETAFAIDGVLMHEFKEFVTQSASIRLAKIHSIPFMRHCQDEDVEPCLRFGSNSKVSARKLTEGICSNTCYIEEATAEHVKEYERMVLAAQQPPSPARNSMSNKNMLWERLQTQYAMYQAPKGGCQTCGRSGPLTHRYRIATSDEWSFIDRFCRDRLVAVCEFYIFVRNIRAGLYSSRAIEDLYSESLRLRLQMFYARSGVLPTMLNELGVTAHSIGNMGPAGEWPDGIQQPRASVSDAGSSAPSTPVTTPISERAPILSRPHSFGGTGSEAASRKGSEEKTAEAVVARTTEAAEPTNAPTAVVMKGKEVAPDLETPLTSTLASAGPEST
ncbi:RAB3A interacting protein [Dissophora globulifera]|uniref:RAB3A interacting protein n=1 Tax=Dissophora globulifera TaxID=979702 RepID=A0A9P6RT15_9FUNG|nr:RAB3A interacting protein [Dissophora globulifera]